MTNIAILHPCDPWGHVPSGITSFIRAILRWAPSDLNYMLVGATADQTVRPTGSELWLTLEGRRARFLPLIGISATAQRTGVPVLVRYIRAMRRFIQRGGLDGFQILDLHRIEPAWFLRHDSRPKNVVLHQDLSILRDSHCDILWRHAPRIYEWIERKLIPTMDHVFAARQSTVVRYRELYPRLARHISFIPTCVDTTVFKPCRCKAERVRAQVQLRAMLRLAEPARRMLVFVGRLDRQKNPFLLLNAFVHVLRRQRDLHLVIVGDGVMHESIVARIRTLGLGDFVSLLGVMSAAEIAGVLRASDVFVLSSAYEGMSIAILEALATGLPVATTNGGEVALVIREGVTGRVSNGQTPNALADAILLTLEEIDSRTAARCALAVERYCPEIVLQSLYENHRQQGTSVAANRH